MLIHTRTHAGCVCVVSAHLMDMWVNASSSTRGIDSVLGQKTTLNIDRTQTHFTHLVQYGQLKSIEGLSEGLNHKQMFTSHTIFSKDLYYYCISKPFSLHSVRKLIPHKLIFALRSNVDYRRGTGGRRFEQSIHLEKNPSID